MKGDEKSGKVKEGNRVGEKGNERRRGKEKESMRERRRGKSEGRQMRNKELFHPSNGSLDRWILAIYQQLLTPLIPLV